MKVAVVVAMLIVMTPMSAAARSIYIVDIQDKAMIMIDLDSIEVHENIHKVWDTIVYRSYVPITLNLSYDYILATDEYDCTNRLNRATYSVSYNKNGDVVDSGDLDKMWKPVVPESVGYTIYTIICGNHSESLRPLTFGWGTPTILKMYRSGKFDKH